MSSLVPCVKPTGGMASVQDSKLDKLELIWGASTVPLTQTNKYFAERTYYTEGHTCQSYMFLCV